MSESDPAGAMRRVRPFVDERLSAFCYACGGDPTTRDHVPAKVFLDDPLPENLPVVGACRTCNQTASADEEYVACLLEVAACGPNGEFERPKIQHILERRPALASRLKEAMTTGGYIAAESQRVRRVAEKIARGLWSYEVGEPSALMVAEVEFGPIAALTRERLDTFLTMSPPTLLPEVGSRLMIKVIEGLAGDVGYHPWQVVQPSRLGAALVE